jgi:hypothetical protein
VGFSTLYLLSESQGHLVLSRLHLILTLVPGYVLKEFGTQGMAGKRKLLKRLVSAEGIEPSTY